MLEGKTNNLMEKKSRHVLVNKRGNEIFSSDSFLGFTGGIILIGLGAFFVLAIIAVIICGIANLF